MSCIVRLTKVIVELLIQERIFPDKLLSGTCNDYSLLLLSLKSIVSKLNQSDFKSPIIAKEIDGITEKSCNLSLDSGNAS